MVLEVFEEFVARVFRKKSVDLEEAAEVSYSELSFLSDEFPAMDSNAFDSVCFSDWIDAVDTLD